MTDHFARTLPIVGTYLRAVRVATLGAAAFPLVHGLAASGIGRWLVESDDAALAALAADLSAQHGPALNLELAPFDDSNLAAAPPNLVIGAGEAAVLRRALDLAARQGIPALLVAPPTSGGPARNPSRPCCVRAILPDDDPAQTAAFLRAVEERPAERPTDWGATAAHDPDALLAAGLARAILLRETAYARGDLARLWAAGKREIAFADPGDPLAVALRAPQASAAPTFVTPPARRGTVLIAGIGSLGSVAALRLLPWFAGFVLADPDTVEAANPIRQAYPVAAIGRTKAAALAARLRAEGAAVVAIPAALDDERTARALIEEHAITAALVTTGTAADFAIARALRAADLPHLAGRCYPRARYWEAILVDGARGPALSDLRGHLALGPAPAPTPEQIAAYSDAGALEAEPATLLESGWSAGWMARLLAQLASPAGLRERWFLDLLAAEQHCLIGAAVVEETDAGPAYGIALPGQIRGYGRAQIRR